MCLFFVICKKITTADIFLHPAFCISETGKVPRAYAQGTFCNTLLCIYILYLPDAELVSWGWSLHNTNGKCRITNLMKPVKKQTLLIYFISLLGGVKKILHFLSKILIKAKPDIVFFHTFCINSLPEKNKTKNTNLFRTGRTFPEGFLRLPEGEFPSRCSASKR